MTDGTTQALASLTPDPRNPRAHGERNRATLAYSLRTLGAARSIVIDEDGVILAGNATVAAAKEAGIERVQVVDADGSAIIAVRRTDLTAAQKRELAYSDNRTGELAEWDLPQLAADLADGVISLDGLWTEGELTTLLAGMGAGEDLPLSPQARLADDLPHATWTLTFPQEAAGIVADTLRELQEGLPELRWKEDR